MKTQDAKEPQMIQDDELASLINAWRVGSDKSKLIELSEHGFELTNDELQAVEVLDRFGMLPMRGAVIAS